MPRKNTDKQSRHVPRNYGCATFVTGVGRIIIPASLLCARKIISKLIPIITMKPKRNLKNVLSKYRDMYKVYQTQILYTISKISFSLKLFWKQNIRLLADFFALMYSLIPRCSKKDMIKQSFLVPISIRGWKLVRQFSS